MRGADRARSEFEGKQVLVTGGTGFIGGRLAERLAVESGARVRVLVRELGRCWRIARFPVEMIRGDVLEPATLARASNGCDVVFHCAYGNRGSEELQRRVNVEGTANVLNAARAANVSRIVYLSTVAVYGATPDGDLDETAPRRHSGHVYMDSKLDAERLALEYVRKQALPVTILQPTAVYGPFAPVWTVGVLDQLKTGRIILVNGGDGLQNVVYVDDVVTAMLLAATKREAVGEVFLISGDEPVTYRRFFERHEQMLGTCGTISLSMDEADARWRSRRGKVWVEALRALRADGRFSEALANTTVGRISRRGARLIVGRAFRRRMRIEQPGRSLAAAPAEKPIHLLDPPLLRLLAAKTRVRIDKARRLLGYEPAFDFATGMQVTERWAEWANLLTPSTGSLG